MGAAQDITRESLEAMTDMELAALLASVDRAIARVDDQAGVRAYRMEAADTSALQGRYFKQLDGITGDLQSGKINLATYDTRMQDAIQTNFTQVYKANLGRPLDEGDLEYLKRATAEEMKYARAFGTDIDNDTLRMPRQQRVGMYSQTLQGIGDHARVEAAPMDSQFVWKLGHAEHCPDCLVLASNSPYTKADLPTTPRAGATRCLSNCECSLIVQPGKLSKQQVQELRDLDMKKDQSLVEMLRRPAPPKGMRLPTEDEQKYIQDLRMKINTNRRVIATADGEKLKGAIRARKAANAELNEFLTKEGIYDVPIWSVDDVLEGRHVGRRAVRDLMRHGIDGKSLGMVERKQLVSMLGEYERATGEVLSGKALKRKARKTNKAAVLDDKRTAELLDKMSKSELSAAEQAELREQLDRLFEGTGMSNERSTIFVDEFNKGVSRNIKTGTKHSAVAQYEPATDTIKMYPGTAKEASKFLQGDRARDSISSMHTLVHETVHSYNRGFGWGYQELGVVMEEAATDLISMRLIKKTYNINADVMAQFTSYGDYIDRIANRVGIALKKAGLKIHGSVEGGGLPPMIFSVRVKHKEFVEVMSVITDAFQKQMGPGKEIWKWERLVKSFVDEVELPASYTKGLSKKAAADLHKKFKKELDDVFSEWVVESGGSKKIYYGGAT